MPTVSLRIDTAPLKGFFELLGSNPELAQQVMKAHGIEHASQLVRIERVPVSAIRTNEVSLCCYPSDRLLRLVGALLAR